jgi:hypothetical protein
LLNNFKFLTPFCLQIFMSIMKRFILLCSIAIFITKCTKIDNTTLGQDLIPAVDGVTTLRTDTFTITAENNIFTDSTTFFKNDDYVLGWLQSNSNFGSTQGTIYAQFNPQFQFTWKTIFRDSIRQTPTSPTADGFDSAFLCLGLFTGANESGIFGDSNQAMTVNVYEIDNTPANIFKKDSAYKIAQDPNINRKPSPLGSLTFKPYEINDLKYFKVKQRNDSSFNQLRIPLKTAAGIAYAKSMLANDTITSGFDAFKNETKYTDKYRGFIIEIQPTGNPNAAMRFSLAQNANSRLEVWYKYIKNGLVDTTYDALYFNNTSGSPYISASANYIKRTIAGSAMQTASAPGIDNTIYLESTPGSYAQIKIPGIKTFPSKMIHLAELIISEDPAQANNSMLNFYAPPSIYLDAYDSAIGAVNKFKSIPYDLSFLSGGSSLNFSYFGGQRIIRNEGLGPFAQYTFNITKYFQNIVTRGMSNMDLRLYVPFDTRYYTQPTADYFFSSDGFLQRPIINAPVFGRAIVGGGAHPTSKMKLRVTYSNL